MIKDCAEWANNIFSECNLGDKRLLARLIKIGGCLAAKVGSNLSSCFKGKNTDIVGAYRFIRNESVKPEAIIQGVCTAVAKESRNSHCLLAIEDTTTVSYQHDVKDQLGYTSNSNKASGAKGYFVHSVILYDPDNKKTLGLVDQNVWARRQDEYGKHHSRKSRPYEEKESFKWENASTQLALRLGKDIKKVISICDREADIFEYITYKVTNEQRFIVRASQDRTIADDYGSLISDKVMNREALGTIEVNITQRDDRKARIAAVELRACTIKLKVPKTRDSEEPKPIEINVIAATEVLRSKDEKRMSWVLLSTEKINSFEEVEKIVRYYAKRWLIEEFHKCWKSGAKVENQRMQTADNLRRMIVILGPVAIRLLQLRENLDDKKNEKSCLEVLNQDEFVVLWRSIENKGFVE